MTIALDIITVAIIAGSAAIGYKKGISYAVRSLIVIVLSFAAAYFLSEPVSSEIYDSSFKQEIISSLSETLREQNVPQTVKETIENKFDIKLTDKDLKRVAESDGLVTEEIKLIAQEKGVELTENEIKKEIESLFFEDKLEDNLGENSKIAVELVSDIVNKGESRLSDMLKAFADTDYTRGARSLEKIIARPTVKSILKPLCMILLFIVTAIIVRIALFMLSILKIVPIASTGVSFVGALFGLVQGILMIVLLAMALSTAMRSGVIPTSVISKEIIEDTIVFKAFF